MSERTSDAIAYNPAEAYHDYLLLGWLQRMQNDGEADKVIHPRTQAPGLFLSFFRPPERHLFFKVNNYGNLSHACWFERIMDGVFVSYYVDPNFRGFDDEKYFMFFDLIDEAFALGMTTVCGLIQERPTPKETRKFLRVHRAMGYRHSGTLPLVFNGKDCHLVSMTKDEWDELDSVLKRRWKQAVAQRGHRRMILPSGTAV